MYEVADLNAILRQKLPNNVKVSFKIDDIKLKSNLKVNQTIIFTRKSFFHTILGFVQSYFGELGDFDRFIQLILGSLKNDKPNNFSGIDDVPLNCDCINGNNVNGVREPILCSFALSSPPRYKSFDEPKIKLFNKTNKPVLPHMTFYLGYDVTNQSILLTKQSFLLVS